MVATPPRSARGGWAWTATFGDVHGAGRFAAGVQVRKCDDVSLAGGKDVLDGGDVVGVGWAIGPQRDEAKRSISSMGMGPERPSKGAPNGSIRAKAVRGSRRSPSTARRATC